MRPSRGPQSEALSGEQGLGSEECKTDNLKIDNIQGPITKPLIMQDPALAR